jgi:small subunit ribosomal protein S5
MSVKYLDDFSKIDPVIDKQPLAPDENYDPNLRFKDEDEIAADLTKWLENLPDDPDPVEFQKFLNDTRVMVGKEEAEMNSRDYSAPELPKLTDPLVRRHVRAMKGKDGTEVMTEHLQRLSKQTGMSTQFLRSLRWKHLVRHRVTNQTRLGKIHSMYYLTVAGNENGLLGIGEGKSTVDEEAARNALLKAYRNLTPIPRYENRTIFGDVKGKVGATELELYTRPPGKRLSQASETAPRY